MTMNDRNCRRFVVLFHSTPAEDDHFDLMIEAGSALATWRVIERPESVSADQPIDCLQIGDHRREYLDYEGPLSGNRGHVKRHDAGHCSTSSLVVSPIAIHFDGQLLKGGYVMERDVHSPDQWRLRLA